MSGYGTVTLTRNRMTPLARALYQEQRGERTDGWLWESEDTQVEYERLATIARAHCFWSNPQTVEEAL